MRNGRELAFIALIACGIGCGGPSGAAKQDDLVPGEAQVPAEVAGDLEVEEAPSAESLFEGSNDQPEAQGASEEKSPAAAVDGGLNRSIRSALERARGGDLDGAANELERLVERPNGGFLAAYNLGLVREAQGAYERAAKAYVASLSAERGFSPALINLVRLYLRQGRTQDARAIADRYVDARPNNQSHRVALIEVMIAEGRYEDAARQARDSLRKDDRNVDALLALAEANYRLGRYELADTVLARAAEFAKERAEIYLLAGLVKLELDDAAAARANFERAVEVRPLFAEAHNNLSVLNYEARDFEAAARHAELALKSWPDSTSALMNLGNAYKRLGKFREAELAYKKAIGIDQKFADAHYNLGLMYIDSEMPGVDKIARLERGIEALGTYKAVSRGRQGKEDPADKYIAEARKAIEDEKARQQMMRESQMDAEQGGGES